MVWNIGFDDGNRYTMLHRPIDADPGLIEYVDTTPDLEGGVNLSFKPGQLHAGRAIKPDHVPTKVTRTGKRYGMPDAVMGLGAMELFFVNETFRQVVERLEPGVHQFFPFDMLWEEDGSFAKKMYIFNICARLDTVSRAASTSTKHGASYWEPKPGKIVYSLSRIGNHHFWIDKFVFRGRFMSDAMHDALVEAGVTGLRFNPMELVEAP